MFTTDSRWIDWHLSRLGEGGQFSAVIFNVVTATCALLMTVFARRLVDNLEHVNALASQKRRAGRILPLGLWLIAACMLGIAIFPFDTYPAVHNVFGYGMTLTFAMLIVATPYVLPIFRRRFAILSYCFLALLAALFVFYFATNGTGIHLLYIEMLALTFFYVWAIRLVHVVRQNSTELTGKLQP